VILARWVLPLCPPPPTVLPFHPRVLFCAVLFCCQPLLCQEFGFRVFEPKKVLHHVFKTDFPQMFKGKHPQRYPAVVQHSEQNAWTVAPSFVHAADLTDADYVLFLEKDFEIPDHVRAMA